MKQNSDREFLAHLHRHEPVSVQELCELVGVTATAVRQKLLRFQAEGVISRNTARQERGRPHHTYQITHEGLKQLGDDQGEMAAILWREIMRIDEPAIRNQVLSGVKSSLIQRFGNSIQEGTLEDRVQKLCEQLSAFGFDVDMASESVADLHPGDTENSSRQLPVLREHNCPYHEIAEEDASFCEFEQSVFSEMLGAKVELSACRLDGHRCCEFQVGPA